MIKYETVPYRAIWLQSDLSITTIRVTLPHARRLWLVRFMPQFAEDRVVKDNIVINHDNIECLVFSYKYISVLLFNFKEQLGMRPVQ